MERVGRYTIKFENMPVLTGFAGVAGKKEGQGPLSREFDFIYNDTSCGEQTWEKAESAMLKSAVSRALGKAKKTAKDVDFMLSGDLLNQCISTTFGLREMSMPMIGMYGACSTMGLTLAVGSILVESGAAKVCGVGTSSHFCSAERQFRYPLEYGGQRTPNAQWTVTGAGCAVIEKNGSGPKVSHVLIGQITDLGIKDANNMGAAMAPAACSSISNFLKDTNTSPNDYDLILTGDLGHVGSSLLIELLKKENFDISKVHGDCGIMIFDKNKQDTHAGGSGCGCSGSVLCSSILRKVSIGELKNILFIGTGALMSPTSAQQGETIPGVAHLVNIKYQ